MERELCEGAKSFPHILFTTGSCTISLLKWFESIFQLFTKICAQQLLVNSTPRSFQCTTRVHFETHVIHHSLAKLHLTAGKLIVIVN